MKEKIEIDRQLEEHKRGRCGIFIVFNNNESDE